MASEMVERAVRALEALPTAKLGCPIYDVDYRAVVLAVMAAMREPTEAMVAAAERVDAELFERTRDWEVAPAPEDTYRAMIDAAQSDNKTP